VWADVIRPKRCSSRASCRQRQVRSCHRGHLYRQRDAIRRLAQQDHLAAVLASYGEAGQAAAARLVEQLHRVAAPALAAPPPLGLGSVTAAAAPGSSARPARSIGWRLVAMIVTWAA